MSALAKADHPIADAPGPDQGSKEQRRHPRHHVAWQAQCTDSTGFSWDAWVVDHSLGGLGLDHCPALEPGQIITVGLVDVGAFPCRVVWSKGARAGVQFERAPGFLSADDVDLLALGLSTP